MQNKAVFMHINKQILLLMFIVIACVFSILQFSGKDLHHKNFWS